MKIVVNIFQEGIQLPSYRAKIMNGGEKPIELSGQSITKEGLISLFKKEINLKLRELWILEEISYVDVLGNRY